MALYYFSDNPNGFVTGKRFSVDSPCVTVMAEGMGGDSLGHWHLADDGVRRMIPKERKTKSDRQLFDAKAAKPPYHVPTMAEIAKVKWNGLTVATTFAGGGGSSLGYRMAGYRVVWANEFVPAAQDTYRANMGRHTVFDGRDIKKVTAAEILKATGLKRGELDLFDGSPPCQAFSTAGRREKGWGTERKYEHGASQLNEDLFFEYVRLLKGLSPRAFVAENVSGLVKGVAKGYFVNILKALKECGYRVEARVLDAQWLGVPQARQRVFFVGVRDDLKAGPAFPSPLPYRYSVRDALPWIGRATHDSGGSGNFAGSRDIAERPSVTVTNGKHPGTNSGHFKVEDDTQIKTGRGGSRRYREENKSNSLDAPMPTVLAGGGKKTDPQFVVVHDTGRKGQAVRDVTDQPCPTVTAGPDDASDGGGPRNHFKVTQRDKYSNEMDVTDRPALTVRASDGSKGRQRGLQMTSVVTGRGSRRAREEGKRHGLDAPLPAVLADGGRKGSAQFMVEQNSNSPHQRKGGRKSVDAPAPTVMARRSNLDLVTNNRGLRPDRSYPGDGPAPTIKAGKHGSGPHDLMVVEPAGEAIGVGGGGGFGKVKMGSLGDPAMTIGTGPSAGNGLNPAGTVYQRDESGQTEKRKFTIAELKRICAFPDDSVLTGSYGAQWERLGNSVPPLMMRAVAEAVRDRILLPAARGRKKR